MHIKIILINGKPGSGKDTFIDRFKEVVIESTGTSTLDEREIVYNTSTIDYVKDIARQLGWGGQKTPEARRLLSKLKDCWSEYNDGPFKQIVEYVSKIEKYHPANYGYVFIFVHVRELAEIKKLKEHYGERAETLLIYGREENLNGITNSADANVNMNMNDYRHIINNAGTLEELKEQAKAFRHVLKRNMQ